MKKSVLITFLAVSVITSSCRRDDTPGKGDITFTATIENEFNTNTILVDGKKVNWEQDDTISVNGVKFIATPEEDATKAKLEKSDTKGVPSAPFHAFYPHYIQSTENIDKGILPDSIRYDIEHPFKMIPMYASNDDGDLHFKNIFGVLAISIKSSVLTTVKKIKLTSDTTFSGEFSLVEKTEGQGDYYAAMDNTGADTVLIDFGENGITPTSEGSVIYVPVPAEKYGYLKIHLSENGTEYIRSMTSSNGTEGITIENNKIYPIVFDNDVIRTDKMYYVGGYNGWNLANPTPFEHSDKSIVEDPFFTISLSLTKGSSEWFAFADSTAKADQNWNILYRAERNGDDRASGYAHIDGSGNSFCQYVAGDTMKIVFNICDGHYEITYKDTEP